MGKYIGSNIEVEWAREDRGCDYLISDERVPGQPKTWKAWELVDGDDVIVVEGQAPDGLAEAVEEESVYEVRWPHECETATVVDHRVEYEERTAYYADQPPEHVAEPVGHREAVELLEARGREVTMGSMEGAWYFPERGSFACVFESTDDAGETYRSWREVQSLGEKEQELLVGERHSLEEGNADELTFVELADRINENAYLYERQSQYVAAIVEGDTQFDEIRDRINSEFGEDLGYHDVSSSYYKMMDRQEEVAWQIVHIWPHIPEKHRSEEMEMILNAVNLEASPRDPEWLLENGD